MFGVLADAELSTADQTRTPGGFLPIKIENKSIFSVNLRAGFAVPPSLLLDATGGYSYLDFRISPRALSRPATDAPSRPPAKSRKPGPSAGFFAFAAP